MAVAATLAVIRHLHRLNLRLRRRSPKGAYQATLDDFHWGLADCLFLWPVGAPCVPAAARGSDKPLEAAEQLQRRLDISELL